MYSRSKKDNYRQKIEELIEGRQKRQRKCSSDDANENIDENMASSEINNSSSNSKIRIQRWIPGNSKVEGNHKYLNII
jgi:hypothetical protein